MALYKHQQFAPKHTDDAAFDKFYKPGTEAPHSGIYRCYSCHKEAVSTAGHPLPSQDRHIHSIAQGEILWQLIVAAGNDLHAK
jgi:hypothetical protein